MRKASAAGAVVLSLLPGIGAILVVDGCKGYSGGNTSNIFPTPTAPQRIGFVVTGFVQDTAVRPLDQARLEIMDGPQAGLATMSDVQGRFSFDGQRFTQGFTLRASKEGHQTAEKSVLPQGNAAYASFALASPTPAIDLAGNYVVSVTADASCTALPPQTSSRSYTATISRLTETAYGVHLGGATFATGPDSPYDGFFAYVFGRFVTFFVWNLSNEVEGSRVNGLIEQLDPEAYLGIGGEAGVTVEGDSIDVPFSGFFAYCPGARANSDRFSCAATPIRCDSNSHRLRLTRE
jgi:hypothetical protein